MDFQIFFTDFLKKFEIRQKNADDFVASEIFKRKKLTSVKLQDKRIMSFCYCYKKVLLFRPVSTLRAEVVFPEAKFGALTAFSKLRYSSL